MAWILQLALAIGGYVVGVCVYRLFWHPLAGYPGPLLGRLTDWYSVYHAIKGDRPLDFFALHAKYGEVIRFGPNRISVNNPEGLRVIYGVQANTQKSRFYSVFDHFFDAPSTETTIDKDEHARKRRVLSQSLSDKALKDKEGAILDNFQRFREQLAVPADLERARGTKYALGEWSPPQDMAQLFSFLTFDIMGNICFGKSLETLLSAENRDLIGLIPDGVQALNALGHMPGILKLRVENLLFPRLIGGLHKYKDCSDMLAKACLEKAPQLLVGPRNVLQSLIDQSVSAKASKTRKFSMRELISETSLLIIAGSDTTSSALANTMFHLLNNPVTLAILVLEIDTTFKNLDEIVTGEKLAACSYLRACIDESLRLSPPVGGLLSREILPGGLRIQDDFFPAGTDIGTPHLALQRSPKIFRNPSAFNPQRWITGDDSGCVRPDDVRAVQSAFCAFSIGSRGCIGRRMAYMELTTVLARLVWLFDMRMVLAPTNPQAVSDTGATKQRAMTAEAAFHQRDNETIDKFVSHVKGPWVQFRARSH